MTDEQTMRELCRQKAAELWAGFTDSEKTGIRFGLLPHQQMTAAEKEGLEGRILTQALMNHAQANGGMRA